jgi:hypothetical protein
VRVGYTVIEETGRPSPSFNRTVDFQPGAVRVIEYAIYWDWDIQHLYELEHAWVHLDEEGEVVFVEASGHGGLRTMWPVEEMIGGTRPLLFSAPGKHAFYQTGMVFEFPPVRNGYLRANTENAGSMGLLITPLFQGKISKTPEDDARVAAWLKKRAFQPTFQFNLRKGIDPELLHPWDEVEPWIIDRVQMWRDRLAQEAEGDSPAAAQP